MWCGAVSFALLLVAVACAPARTAPDTVLIEAATDEDRELVVRVENNLIPPSVLSVWIVPETGTRRMLGTVNPQDATSFPVDALAVGQYRLLARTTAGAEVVSQPFAPAVPGVVRWDISANIVAVTGLDEKRTPNDP